MAWTTPTTRAAGYVVPDTVWNSDVVDNPIALRAGGIAIASQAVGDILYATSATQLGRLAAGTTSQVLIGGASAPAWSNTPTLTGTNFSGIPATAVSSGTFAGSTAAVFGGTLAWGGGSAISSSSVVMRTNAVSTVAADYIEIANASNTEKALYVNATANGTAAAATFRFQNVAYTGYVTLPTATFTTSGLREANVMSVITDGPTLRLGTSFGTGVVQIYSANLLAVTFGASQAATFSGGVIGTGATGGDKGAGTANFTAVYDDNVLLTDWVFDLYYDGHTALPMPAGGRLFSLQETQAATKAERRLPWMPTRESFEADRHVGGMVSRLWFGQEQQQAYICELEARIAVLEAAAA